MAARNPPTMSRIPYPPVSAAGILPVPSAPPGTFAPGTKVQVGNHRVVIDRYLSEGGFAHVYVVTLPKPVDGQEKAVLKRVAVPDKGQLANMRTEVETMKRLRGHKYIVKYIDSHASSLKAGGYEVFLLMEFCQGGGLIDFMNTRLQNRLTEPEILKIFTDIAEGVACMHYLKPPLMHRDLKIENVLISTSGKEKIYKLCDFGSAAVARPAATSTAEGRLIEEDIQQHTTLQYRSPEMIDVYRKHPIDEKSDIWALGCFLYKLCYYTTPFEEVGQMAILNASFKYPGYPKFSDQLKLLIATMLREQPSQRPNIYQVLQKACQMDKRELRIKDIYINRTQSEKARNEALPENTTPISRTGASIAPPKQETLQAIPDIAPMRRGRPSAPTSHHNSARPSPSPLRMMEGSDPFAHLDGNKVPAGDELSSKFPTLDQFSLMTDKSSRFAFQPEPVKNVNPTEEDLSKRVTNALADEAFVRSPSPVKTKPVVVAKSEAARATTVSAQQKSVEVEERKPQVADATVFKKSNMVSTGTMTNSPGHSPSLPPISDKPVWRVPNAERSSSSGPATKPSKPPRPTVTSNKSGSRLASLLKNDASRSQQGEEVDGRSANSSRPSMEGGRPSLTEFNNDSGLSRSRSLNIRNRPVSVNMGSGPTHIRDRELKKSDLSSIVTDSTLLQAETAILESDKSIASDIDFLKAKEEEEKERNKHIRRGSSKGRHGKRASLPSIALAGTKNMLQGRFGDAFKKFEGAEDQRDEPDSFNKEHDAVLTPIAGSEATDLSEDRNAFDETEDLSPEVRRELEKRRLEAEERRVANAAAEYRQRTAGGSGRPPVPSGKAALIQSRMQALLQDSERPVQKTATGYGQYTREVQPQPISRNIEHSRQFEPSAVPQRAQTIATAQPETRSISAPASQIGLQKLQRPTAPPKPKLLQTPRADALPVATSDDAPPQISSANAGDDWEEQFSKRYPSLSHLEMVETEIENRPLAQKMTVREV